MIVGLTGGIGSGKSIVAQLMQVMGCVIYNSDERAKQMYFEKGVKSQIINLLGKKAYKNEQEINRDYISQKVFKDTLLLHQLNQIIHPAVKNDFIAFCSHQPTHRIIVKESALLFETGIFKELELTILVTARDDVKIERVMKRNAVSGEEVKKRMAAQWPDDKKTALASFIISNNPDEALIPQVIPILKKINEQNLY